jgi:hypothetical protein
MEEFMNITTIKKNNTEIAVIQSNEVLVTDVRSALDFIATIGYKTGCNHVILNKSAISEDFFDLKTRLAGEILQKFTNYRVKIAIIGNFSVYTSKSLKDFIYESNKGNAIFFVQDQNEAAEKLSKV